MSRDQHAVARLRTSTSPAVILSCEHASNRLPARYKGLGLDAKTLASHIAWDIGARRVARAFAREIGCELHEGQWSRLLVDLNRSARHRKVIAEKSAGTVIPGNVGLTPTEREERLLRYWLPYRTAVESAIEEAIAGRGFCVHLSVHSFAPALGGRTRNADVGILYDPRRRKERELARSWARDLLAAGVRVRLNYPYRGTADGLSTALRRRFPASAYAGLELEINQRLFSGRPSATHITRVTQTTFLAMVRSKLHAAR